MTKGPKPRPALERFLEKVDKRDDGCWQWLGGKKHHGYGHFYTKERRWNVHRFAYEHLVGPIPEGLELDHLCRNTSCVNPDHLEPVTTTENHRRANALRTHCSRGHEYTEASTIWQTDRNGYRSRSCRTCRYAANRRRYAEAK